MKELISILDGNTFLVSDRRGDIEPSLDYPTGLFSFDTRFLSTWVLTLDGERLNALSVDEETSYDTTYFLVPGAPSHYIDAKISVLRYRAINGSFEETLTVLNHTTSTVELTLRIDIGTDFADLFEIKNAQRKPGGATVRVEGADLLLSYRRERFHREVRVTSSVPGAVDEQGMTFHIRVEQHAEWRTKLVAQALVVGADGRDFRESLPIGLNRTVDQIRAERRSFVAAVPRLICDYEPLATAYQCSVRDLGALRYESITFGSQLIAAGLPWFMTLFGRDSIFTGLQALPFLPRILPPTIAVLAGIQGSRLDDFRDEEPGKILHELRYGELAGFEEQPHSPYYGSADSTPLFLILLDEYERWTGDQNLVRRLEPEARAAIDWIDTYGNSRGTGYIYYQTRNPETGLPNQCWKDSPDAIAYRDGRLPGFPRATCELQGYAYDAKVRTARLARTVWHDHAYAERLEREAADLKQRFNRDFWVADGGYYALALDADGNQVDALSSNIGHLLWSGIVDDDRARTVGDHLLGPDMFTGWGVRTLASGQARYNPLGYHVGTVWPFDNSIIAWGLWRYGMREEAGRICAGMLEAARHFQGRLPEAFAGYHRDLTNYPVEYPTACSPQAWSAGTPLLLLRVMLGLQPHDDHLVIDPDVPPGLGRIEVLDIPGRWGGVDALGRSRPD
ncbi:MULTISPECIES: glycogen debranching N-terminal domain-containing protein [unclassified Micromonospora]|uniref:amylo-alpha-1,6-glucosidase n=1 Tax=unclassified Micromonospora TaxID=2617518 RepID=UPI001C21127B|nr:MULTISPECIES: glycogen debranching N-terminal domain-containing protein [unclassified Micromonospora]MBU8861523.1 amylo-alpha-1,6-glucosidase [Micromonospora sp. WMMB482]MDM4781091.1 glycogen debranching N-terminal domain-containing protein [Micromonospora sp. b486]